MEDTVDFSIAVRPNDIDAVPGIVKGVVEKAAALSPGDETARHALLIQARSLVQALETPRETMTKHTWAQVRMKLGNSFFSFGILSNLDYYQAGRRYRSGHWC
jgi:isopentenyl diphosphate isomerase/L-lactate dehydrogenase-like FMN-dependent dehydrogenase